MTDFVAAFFYGLDCFSHEKSFSHKFTHETEFPPLALRDINPKTAYQKNFGLARLPPLRQEAEPVPTSDVREALPSHRRASTRLQALQHSFTDVRALRKHHRVHSGVK